MPRKPKFKPRITRIKLNPEQAVLQCDCYRYWSRAVVFPIFGVAIEGGAVSCLGRTSVASKGGAGPEPVYRFESDQASS